MIPKRKLIKKLRSQQKPIVDQTQVQSHQSIFEKLKSINPAIKEQAVTILANLHISMPQFLNAQFSRELVNLLYQANNTLVYQTIFAMANLCEIQPALTRMLFQQGLDKALVHLPSTNNQLLKPILIFFITVCQSLPKKYHYLLQGIRNSLRVDHLSNSPDLCLQFLFRTYNQSAQKLSQPIINAIVSIYKATQSISEKSYSVAVMSKQLQGNKEVQQIFVSYMTELLVCIDLAKEYQMNFSKPIKPSQTSKIQQRIDNDEQMQEDQQGNHHKPNQHILSVADRQKLKFFNQTISGIEILLEFLLDILQKDDEDWSQQEENDQEDQQVKNQPSTGHTSQLKPLILGFIRQNMIIFPKFLTLSSSIVPDSQNVVYLFYHLLMHIDKHLQSSSPNNQQNLLQINHLVQVSLQNLFASIGSSSHKEQNAISIEQYETLVQCLEIGLGVLMKNKGVGVSQDWLINFGKGHMMAAEIFNSFKLVEQIKPSWLIMLQLYSKVLNPQKNPNITSQQNFTLGQILKQLIISIPYTELEELRCQVIDTLFDVYSNEKFDQAFVQLGFFEVLEAIFKQSHSISNKQGTTKTKTKTKTRKQQKFVQDVLKDVKRFLEYKHKMIKK